MDSFTQYREHIGKSLTLRLADAMENGVVTTDEVSEIAGTILKGIDATTTHEELMKFLEELAGKWTLFGPVLIAEQSEKVGEVVEQHEEQAVDQIGTLLKENKLDEAIATAEHATEESAQETANIQQNPTTPPIPAPENPTDSSMQIQGEN